MIVIEMIQELKRMNIDVTYRKRTDGGYIITAINGVKYTAAKGNQQARVILNNPLSTKRATQTIFNINKFIKAKKKPKKIITDEFELIKRQLRKVQRIWRKEGRKGQVTLRKVRYYINKYGYDEARRYLEQQENYGRGYAYEQNVKWLVDSILRYALNFPSKKSKLEKLANDINDKKPFMEKWIYPIYEQLYSMKTANDVETIIQNIYNILNT